MNRTVVDKQNQETVMFQQVKFTLVTLVVLIVALPANADVYPPPDGSFTIAILPDTQNYTVAESLHEIFLSQTRWIAENHERQKIAFVLHEGDVTQHNNEPQWTVAKEAFEMLDEAGVPYVITLGNHDYGTSNGLAQIDAQVLEQAKDFFGM